MGKDYDLRLKSKVLRYIVDNYETGYKWQDSDWEKLYKYFGKHSKREIDFILSLLRKENLLNISSTPISNYGLYQPKHVNYDNLRVREYLARLRQERIVLFELRGWDILKIMLSALLGGVVGFLAGRLTGR